MQDAEAAVAAGADALGLMFYQKSPRALTMEMAREIASAIPPFIPRVGVFVDPDPADVYAAVASAGLHMVQFHGDETPEFCCQFGVMSIKAVRVQNRDTIDLLPLYRTDAWLLDSYVPGQLGGTGAQFNWDLAVEAKKWNKPVFLAGGLNPENVGDAVRRVHPYGVDVSSGVESAPGRKDPARMQAFVTAAKKAWLEA